jgi:hypothetical protein
MSKKDELFLTDLEQELKDDLEKKVFINNISQLTDFPFKDLDEIRQAYNEKGISLASDYSYNRLMLYATKSEIKIHFFWLALPFIIAIIDLVLAIVLKRYVLLIGCVATVLGYFSSSPYFKLRNSFAGITIILAIISIFFNLQLAVVIGSYSLGLIFTMTAREHYNQVIIERALTSETFFVWLFLAKAILIRDNKTKKILIP